MPRANSSVPHHRKHRKIVGMAKGYRGARSKNYVSAKDAVEKALQYAYRDRRNKNAIFAPLDCVLMPPLINMTFPIINLSPV